MNLLLDPTFAAEMREGEASLRHMVSVAAAQGIPVPAMGASLAYYDSYRRERGPAYLTQAQRDYFGAHTFERVDQPGSVVHFDWIRKESGSNS